MDPDDYRSQDWAASAGHAPLAGRPHEDLLLLHRHWMWANQHREVFESLIGNLQEAELLKMGAGMLATKQFGFMLVWYGLLWAVIEAFLDPKEGRCIDLRGPFRAEIDTLSPSLRVCRNAILHVPRSGDLLDDRILQLLSVPGSALMIRRVARGFARLFLEEYARRDKLKAGKK
jgi:hypothetical protein